MSLLIDYFKKSSQRPDPDTPSEEHLAKLEREYLLAVARKNDEQLYNVVRNILIRINRALTYQAPDPYTTSNYDSLIYRSSLQTPSPDITREITPWNPFPEPSSYQASEPPLLIQAYWSLQTDLQAEEERLAKKFKPRDFNYVGSSEDLHKLFKNLNGYFEVGTKEENFQHIFKSIPGYEEWELLNWRKSNRLLAYLLSEMSNRDLICNDWQSVAGTGKFFTNQRNKVFKTNDLAKAISDIKTHSGNPKEFEFIDSALAFIPKK